MTAGALHGCHVLVTRPEGQAESLINAIRSAGGEALHFPAIRIVGRDVDDIEDELKSRPEPDVLVFISRNAVTYGYPPTRRFDAAIAAVGPATQAALEDQGATVDIFPDGEFDSEGLLAQPALDDVDGKNVLIVRGERGRELLAETLTARGAMVQHLTVYRRERAEPPPELAREVGRAIEHGEFDYIIIMSTETLNHLLALLPSAARDGLRKTPLVGPGERVIQNALLRLPGNPALVASGPTPADMVKAIAGAWLSGKNS